MKFSHGLPETRINTGGHNRLSWENQKPKALIGKTKVTIDARIVIPVVVGSSPISHPKN